MAVALVVASQLAIATPVKSDPSTVEAAPEFECKQRTRIIIRRTCSYLPLLLATSGLEPESDLQFFI